MHNNFFPGFVMKGRLSVARAVRCILLLLILISSGVVAQAKVISAVPGVNTFAYGVWYFTNCNTSAGLGSFTINIQPMHGAASVTTTSGPIPGCPSGSPSLPLAASYYTMSMSTPPAPTDYFQLEFFLNGTDHGPVDVFVVNGNIVGKQLGGSNTPNKKMLAEPIDIASGNVSYSVTDYTTAGQNPLALTRYYNSLGYLATPVPLPELSLLLSSTLATGTGMNWRSNYDRYLKLTSGTTAIAERPDGQQLNFTLNGSTWTPDSDIDMTLSNSGNQWTLTDSSDTVETYTTATLLPGVSVVSLYAQLSSIRSRNGYTQTLNFANGALSSVTDSYNRSLTFAYSNGLLQSVTTPDGLVVSYTYTAASSGAGNQLTGVTYSTSPQTSQTYAYSSAFSPFFLTGITDENGSSYATWAYDGYARGTSSQLGVGVNATTIVYNLDGSRTVKNALGVTDTYKLTTLQTIPKVIEIDRAASSTTAAASEIFTYDGNGYLASQTDWNGNQSTFVNNSHGLPTTVTEAAGTGVARTTTISYDATWIHSPATVVETGVTTNFTYDSQGELLTRTLQDTTTATAPYSTAGQTRTWTNTWSNDLLASTQTPNGNTTRFTYDSTGALTALTDALNHVTQITAHSAGGLPKTIVDANGVTTTRTYDLRQRILSSTVSGTTGTYVTNWVYDAAGNLTKTALPDNSSLSNVYDTAHRLTKITDADGNAISFTLDALGDRTQTTIAGSGGTVTWQRSGTFDALGRELVETAGAGQTTTRTFDPNGNVLTVTDHLGHATTQAYDALNRLIAATDANGAATTPSYDSHNRVISVTDANGHLTSYSRDGFGDVVQQASPDSGTALFHYDGDSNVTSKTDALGIVTNQTFDQLDRPLTTTYPSDTAENVAYSYDQTGSGFSFGIGRLTSVTDAAGSVTRSYDERGNLLTESRANPAATLTTSYSYDAASRIASMTYPDGTLVNYQHDAAGYLANVTATPSGASSATTIGTFTHEPFGPIAAVTYGNTVRETWTFDKSYRATNITDTLSSAAVQNLTYAYDAANNVSTITDAVNTANNQTLGYDAVNRLLSAVSGPGGYGSYSWTYDQLGNRLTQAAGSTRTSYGYSPGSNRLAAITSGASGLPNVVPVATPASLDTAAISPALETSRMTEQSVAPLTSPQVTPSPGTALQFIPITPCRIADTRNASGAFGGPELSANSVRSFSIPQSGCGIPSSAAAYALNVTVVPNTSLGYLTLWPTGQPQPLVSTLNSDGRVKANAAIVPAGTSGNVSVYASDATQVILDINGYFVPAGTASALAFYAVTPCRLADTRNAAGPLGGPSLPSGSSRSFPVQAGSCGIPASAQAYSVNVTAVPHAGLSYLTTWPTGQTQPLVSTLNAPTGDVTANAAVVQAGTNGNISVFVTDASDVILDVNGYFAAPASGGLSLYTMTPCRILDTRNNSGAFSGLLPANAVDSVCSLPPGVQGYVLNTTVVPSGGLGYLTIWPDGETQPLASTLNASTGVVTSNMAIVPTINGSIDVFASDPTNVIVDVSSYFGTSAPATPQFSVPGGTYAAAQSVNLTDSDPNAAIYYTTDGSMPTNASLLYAQPVFVSTGQTLNAIAVASGSANSALATATYVIGNTAVATPTFAPLTGAYTPGQTVTIADPTAGATIYFTTDGTTPTTSSPKYTAPVVLFSSLTIKAIAAKTGLTTSAVSAASFLMGEAGTVSVVTNANGNITSIPPENSTLPATFTYNAANRLAYVTGTAIAASYVYDYAGKRITKTNPSSPSILYTYAQDGSLISQNNSGTLTDYIYADGRPIAVLQPALTPAANQVNYLLADRLGTPQKALNSSGTVVWSSNYSPFGEAGDPVSSITQNLRLPGQNSDPETGFSQNGFRDYMPGLGRYLETDPIGLLAGQNTYLYVVANPHIGIDPSGLCPSKPKPSDPVDFGAIAGWTGFLGTISEYIKLVDESLEDLPSSFVISSLLSAADIIANLGNTLQNPTVGNALALGNSIISLDPAVALSEAIEKGAFWGGYEGASWLIGNEPVDNFLIGIGNSSIWKTISGVLDTPFHLTLPSTPLAPFYYQP